MIITVTLTPALDKTVTIPDFETGKLNRIASIRLDAGGKGINVSKVLGVLGMQSTAMGILGGSTGEWIEQQLRLAGILPDFVHVPRETRTNLKIIDPVRSCNTDINEPGDPVDFSVYEEVVSRILARAREGDIVVFAGKAPQKAPDNLYGTMIRSLSAHGIRSFLDADDASLAQGIQAFPDLIKPNLEELSRLVNAPTESISDVAQAALSLHQGGIRTVIVSLGARGAVFVRDHVLYSPGVSVPVGSTVGAGDAMMAAFCYGESVGLSFEETCRLSVAVSAAKVMQSGTQPPDRKDIDALLGVIPLSELTLSR
ncbi:MAG: 1-phosphofructokinase family hexose kinase [Clostridia bacterium]|nr:1-phosphofructokinase family hexose kinase [Clostridia bacterium]